MDEPTWTVTTTLPGGREQVRRLTQRELVALVHQRIGRPVAAPAEPAVTATPSAPVTPSLAQAA